MKPVRILMCVVMMTMFSLFASVSANAVELPAGFSQSTVWSGFKQPVAVRFAPDGTVFVLEKGGLVKRYDSLDDETASVAVDRRAETHDWNDRGMLGLAIDPGFPQKPFIYISYPYDRDGEFKDDCSTAKAGCVLNARVSRVDVSEPSNPRETVLVEDYCQQFSSHSVGDLAFGADGQLYASGGDGASYSRADIDGATNDDPPKAYNPCGDPDKEGGALRSQDIETDGDELGLGGSVMRIDPTTPMKASERADRMVAYGLRNPFRLDIRPGSNEAWVGDVGWSTAEEINRTVPGERSNFGWPCYEGDARQSTYEQLRAPICQTLYSKNTAAKPFFSYRRSAPVAPGEPSVCGQKSQSISAMQFYDGKRLPSQYRGALFFGDYVRGCIWVMPPGADGLPDRSKVAAFMTGSEGRNDNPRPADLQTGPDGDLYFASVATGEVRRIRWHAPAKITASPQRGTAPLDVSFDGRTNEGLRYAWDLDGDGQYDDSTAGNPTHRFDRAGSYRVRLKITDPAFPEFEDTAETTIEIGAANTAAPKAAIDGDAKDWKAGDALKFTATATAGDGSKLSGDSLRWDLQRCKDSGCEQLESFTGQNVEFSGPEGALPFWLVLRLTATQSDGQKSTVERRLDPRSATVRVLTNPADAGIPVTIGSASGKAPQEASYVIGSSVTVKAPTAQRGSGGRWEFTGWPEGGSAERTVVLGEGETSLTAHYRWVADTTPPNKPNNDRLALHGARWVDDGTLGFDGVNDSATYSTKGLALYRGFTISARVRPSWRSGRAALPLFIGEKESGSAFSVRSLPDGYGARWRGALRIDRGLSPWRTSTVVFSWDGRTARLTVDGRRIGESYSDRTRLFIAWDLYQVRRIRIGGDPRSGSWLRGTISNLKVTVR